MDLSEKLAKINKRLSDETLSEKESKGREILDSVKKNGDEALRKFTEKFDGQKVDNFKVETGSYLEKIDIKLKHALARARYRIRLFHQKELLRNWSYEGPMGEKLGVKYSPIESVGVYVPGGSAPLVSTVLMTVVPAKVAGVKRIVMVSPPPINDAMLAAAELAGVDEIYQIGGAQAIAALAYGTETIKPVDKIVGPGNIYVSLAKKQVFGKVGIDGIYGPSELAVLADENANPKFIAADLLSQLEHGSGLESVLLVSDSDKIIEESKKEVQEQLTKLGKSPEQLKTINESLEKWSDFIKVADLKEGADVINQYAPEHLELMVNLDQKDHILSLIKNAGAIFIGSSSCESLGDYFAGPSHCLPTGGTARFSSGLQSSDFIKKSSVIDFSETDKDTGVFKQTVEDVALIARAEKLEGHARAMELRAEIKDEPKTWRKPKREEVKEEVKKEVLRSEIEEKADELLRELEEESEFEDLPNIKELEMSAELVNAIEADSLEITPDKETEEEFDKVD